VRALCVLVLIAGCNRVWGFDRPDAALDAESDATVAISISSLTISGEVATGESADITATLMGTPNATVPYAFAGTGAFSLPTGDAVFGDDGRAVVVVRYTAPAQPKFDLVTFTAGDEVEMLTVDVLSLETIGFDIALGTTAAVPKDTLHGVPLVTSGEGTFRSLGIFVSIPSGVHNARFALYAGDATEPGMLLGSTPSQLLVNGRNVAPLSPPVHVGASSTTYWVLAVFDAATAVSTDTGLVVSPTFTKTQGFGVAFPATISSPAAVNAKQQSYFVQFARSPTP
jgi:hypothetical protein